MALALADAAATPADVDYVNAHATGTQEHDEVEMRVYVEALGCGPHKRVTPYVYANKGALGHGLGAAGLVSLVLACLCAKSRSVPPMPWLTDPIGTPFPLTPEASNLKASSTHAVFAAGFGGLMAALTAANERATLNLANRLYGQRGFGFAPDYLALLDRHYGAGLEQLDFRADPDAARRAINAWVEGQTAQKIRDLLAPGSLDGGTRLVLVNAIYFLGTWQEPLPVDATAEAPFHRERGGAAPVPFMHVTGRFG